MSKARRTGFFLCVLFDAGVAMTIVSIQPVSWPLIIAGACICMAFSAAVVGSIK